MVKIPHFTTKCKTTAQCRVIAVKQQKSKIASRSKNSEQTGEMLNNSTVFT